MSEKDQVGLHDAFLDKLADVGISFEMDGTKVCATFNDHLDLMQSPAGFGDTNREALRALLREWSHAIDKHD